MLGTTGTESFKLWPIITFFSVACFGYGCVLILAVLTIFTMLRNGMPHSHSKCFLLVTVTAFFILSTVYHATSSIIAYIWVEANYGDVSPETSTLRVGYVSFDVAGTSGNLILLLNDAVVVWRAWAVVQHHVLRVVLVISLTITAMLMLTASVVVAVSGFSVSVFSDAVLSDSLSFSDGTYFQPPIISIQKSFSLTIAMPLLVFTNVISTLTILRTILIYRKEVKTHLQLSMRKTQVEQILLLMIESGFIYCGILILFLSFVLTDSLSTHKTPGMLLAAQIVGGLMPFTAPIYSFIIILAVEHQKSSHSSTIRESTIRFASAPITSTQQDLSGRGNVSIIQSIADYMEFHRNEGPTRSEDLLPVLSRKESEGR